MPCSVSRVGGGWHLATHVGCSAVPSGSGPDRDADEWSRRTGAEGLGDRVPDRVDRVRESALEAQTHPLALAHEPAERCVLVAHGRLVAAISPSTPRSQRYARQSAGGASVARVMMVP